jgi:hypothetical protein
MTMTTMKRNAVFAEDRLKRADPCTHHANALDQSREHIKTVWKIGFGYLVV